MNTRAILIDRAMGSQRPSLASSADVQALEAVPFAQRCEAVSTLDAIRIGASHDPQAPALQFLPGADAAEPAQVWSHGEFLAHVTRAANLFHVLGVGPDDVVSLLLPLVPQGSGVLDVGCGIGATTAWMVRRYGCRVYAIDIVADFVDAAARRFAGDGMAERATAQRLRTSLASTPQRTS